MNNKKLIIFPCHPCDNKMIDPDFASEYNVAKLLGFDVVLFDYDKFVGSNDLNIRGFNSVGLDTMNESTLAIYRGWMINDEQYKKLYDYMMINNHYLINSPDTYNTCHYFPYVYEYIKDHTPKANYFTDLRLLSDKFNDLNSDVIMKDFVKSEKTLSGIDRISKDISPIELEALMVRFINQRGKLFNKGIVLKEFVNLKKYGGEVNEYRTFVIKNDGDVISMVCNRNSNIDGDIATPSLEWIRSIANNVPSGFFTIDVAEKEDGEWIVIETGDGQVSGLSPNQNPIDLYNNLMNI